MIVEKTPAGFVGYITRADFEQAEQFARRADELEALAGAAIERAAACMERKAGPGFRVLLNPNAGKNSKTGQKPAVVHAHALRVRARTKSAVSISENITLRKLK